MTTTFKLLAITILFFVALFVWADWMDWRRAVDWGRANERSRQAGEQQIEAQRKANQERIDREIAGHEEARRRLQRHIDEIKHKWNVEQDRRIERLENR